MEERRRVCALLIVALLVCCTRETRPPELHDSRELARYRAVALQRRSGVYPFVFDRNGAPIASWVMASHHVVAANDDFDVFAEALQARGFNGKLSIETTLDADVQRAAMNALGDLRASLVAIDPRTNEVLAVASRSPLSATRGERPPDPFAQQYEPGSVIKVLTLLAALSKGVDVQSFFPYDCKGYLDVDGRHFGDWHPGGHGQLPDVDEALAESCNVAFAAIGLRTGRAALRDFHGSAGFDGQTNLGLFPVTLGKTVGSIFNNFETGFYAIGLEHETITTFHLAMLGSMLANRGALTTPRIYRARRTMFGAVVDRPPMQATEQLAPRAAAERVAAAMEAVVTRPKGTGRRARVEGVRLAVKTGTAGEREHGYDALLVGFAPADHPTIAFALIAENAGAAEFAAAKVAHDFVEGLRASGHL
jgi:cell division protein FtsI/penicillin-binding protein 2